MKKRVLKAFLCSVAALFVLAAGSWAMVRYSNIAVIRDFRETIVATAMTTMNNQWIARVVASDAVIEQVMANRLVFTPEQIDGDAIRAGMGIAVDLGEDENIPDRETDPAPVEYTEPVDWWLEYQAFEYVDDSERHVDHTLEQRVVYVCETFSQLEEGLYLKDIEGSNFRGRLMLVTDPARVFVAATRTLGTRGDLVRQMVPMNGGVAGINGGWFYDPGFASDGGVPRGFIIQNGQVVWQRENPAMMVGFTWDNVMLMGEFSVEEALAAGVRDALMTTPIIVANGEGLITQGDGGWGIAPRTAIGQRIDGAVLMLVIDGRQPGHSIGGTLRNIQDIMLEHLAHNAIMLDGGSSTVMWHNGEYLNRPSLGWERYIPNSFVVRAAAQ